MHRPNPIVPIIILLLLAGGYYAYTNGLLPINNVSALGATTSDANIVSGFIEGDEVNVAAEVSGRIATLNVNEGDHVSKGQTVVTLDRTVLDAQLAQARAALDTAQAQLAQIQAGPRASDVAAAQSALAAAQQNYDKLKAGATASDLAAAQAALAAAQKNYDKVKAGPTLDQLAQLKLGVDNAKVALNQAQAAYDKIGGATNPNIGLLPQSKQLEQATNAYAAAQAAFNDARSHPTSAELAAAWGQVQQAQAALARLTPDAAQLSAAQAQVEQAQASLARLTPTAETIAVAQKQVAQAQAALAVLQAQSSKMTLVSTLDGIVSRRALHAGEIATPGATVLSITNLESLKLTIYVPETEIGHFNLGDEIAVQVDSFPTRVFKGRVIFIATQAEFTPRNVQTKVERVNTVFAVKLELPNSDLALKPGMPADAALK